MKTFFSVLLVFLISQLAAVNQDQVKVVGHEPIHAKVGDNVTLPCHLEPPFDVNNLTIEWRFKGKEIYVHRSGAKDDETPDPKYKGQTSLLHKNLTDGNISLILTNVTKEDEGNYTCFVPKLQSKVKKGNVTLIVDENGPQGNLTDPEGGNGENNGWNIGPFVGIPGFLFFLFIFVIIFATIYFITCIVFIRAAVLDWQRERNQRRLDRGERQQRPEPRAAIGPMAAARHRRGNDIQGDEDAGRLLQNQGQPN